jgi:hypothetical protein
MDSRNVPKHARVVTNKKRYESVSKRVPIGLICMKTGLFFKIYFVLFTLTSCSVFGVRSGFTQLTFNTIQNIGDVEIRNYPARVIVEASHASNRNEAFSSLFNYISGENSVQKSISMTTPVEINETASEKISMTAPVEIQEDSYDKKVTMRFFLPEKYTLETAPEPKNKNLIIKELPAQIYAVLRYSGSSSHEKFLSKEKELLGVLKSSKWKIIGPVSFLGYDPPFTIPFLKRNEVIVPVE